MSEHPTWSAELTHEEGPCGLALEVWRVAGPEPFGGLRAPDGLSKDDGERRIGRVVEVLNADETDDELKAEVERHRDCAAINHADIMWMRKRIAHLEKGGMAGHGRPS